MARRNKRSAPATQPPEVPQEAPASEQPAADEPQGDGANPTWAPTGNDSALES